jgi:hypothetical protein
MTFFGRDDRPSRPLRPLHPRYVTDLTSWASADFFSKLGQNLGGGGGKHIFYLFNTTFVLTIGVGERPFQWTPMLNHFKTSTVELG